MVSDNFYHRTLKENNYQALKTLPKTSLKWNMDTPQEVDGDWQTKVSLENASDVPALMVRLNLVGEQDGKQFLPVFYSDNYFSLLPGEKKEVSIRWKDVDTRGNAPKLLVTGYNVK